jgi:regulator of sigma E protease
MSALYSIFYLLLALSILVLVHEWGHFIVARKAGVRVLRFAIGFGPELLGFTRGDARWSICAIPFGGYVRFAGDDPEEGGVVAPDEYLAKGLGARTAIVLAGPVMNYILAILLFAFVAWTDGEPAAAPALISQVVEGSAAESVGLHDRDRVTSVNGAPVTNWQDLTQALHGIEAEEPFTVEVDRGGQKLALQGQASAESGFGPTTPFGIVSAQEPIIGHVRKDGPAWNAGLRSGDRILEFDGEPARSWADFAQYTMDHPGQDIAVAWDRDGHRLEATLTPASREHVSQDGEARELGLIEVFPLVKTTPVGPVRALSMGLDNTWELTRAVLGMIPKLPVMVGQGVLRLITGEEAPDEGLGGPVRMAEMFGEAARYGSFFFIGMMASISAQLAIFNLLPIPVLDGGHLALHLVEFVMRRPPSIKIKIILNQIGFALLLLLMLSVTAMDVGRILP